MVVNSFFAFWTVSLLFVLIPGADWAYAMAAGIRSRFITPAVSGLLLGHITVTLIVAAGVGALVAHRPGALTVLTVGGALYLAWMGVKLLVHPPVPAVSSESEEGTWKGWLFNGFGVSGLNPKVFLLFLALLPQFTNPTGSWPLFMQIVALGLLHVFNCGVIYLAVGHGARKVLHMRPRAARIVSQVSGAVMIAIAIILIAERVFAHH